MAELLSNTNCRFHPDRPAGARCTECHQFFCTECVTEHDGQFTCAACLRKESDQAVAPAENARLDWFQPAPILHVLLAVSVIWVLFFLVAQFLTNLPDTFHEGSIWRGGGEE
ncbi:MAG: B-box zinc finger protein [Verrucomicrobiota bacterium]